MRGVKPNKKMWEKVNQVILGESMAEVIVTFQSAMCQMIMQGGICETEDQARTHLAAMLLSPDTGDAKPGSLLPMLKAELARLDGGKWLG